MSARFQIDVSEEVLRANIVAYTVISEVLKMQFQPIYVISGDQNSLLFKMRVNLNEQQCKRLIVKEVEKSLNGYEIEMDWQKKEMKVTRVNVSKQVDDSVNKAKRTKSVKPSKQASAGGSADIQTVI